MRIYIDLAWEVRWDAVTGDPVGVDMDLDVVKAIDGRGIWIDDRNEWDEHRVAYGYPVQLVDRLEQVAVDLERQVTASAPPYDDATAAHWLGVLRSLGDR